MDQNQTPQNISPQPVERSNPLLKRIQMPGETFTLPSGGMFYNDDELDSSVRNVEIRVHPMTAIDEICLRTPDMLFSGDAIRQVFARCIPQVLKPDKLLAKDVDFLLVCLRKVSYGNDLQIQHTHTCENAKEHTYVVDVGNFIKTAKKIDPTNIEQTFTVTMPNDQRVHLKPITYETFIKILQTAISEKDKEGTESVDELRNFIVDSLVDVIIQVDEVTDSTLITEWLNQIPPSYIKLVNEKIENTLKWGTNFVTKVKCKDCNKMMDITAPMNPLIFFT